MSGPWTGTVEGRIRVQVLEVREVGGRRLATVRLELLDQAGNPLAQLQDREVEVGKDAWLVAFGTHKWASPN